MARINIEDSLFRDQRFTDLLLKVGCQYKALGLLARAWILAQQNWIKHGAIPAKAWSKSLDIIIDFDLAERREDGSVYVKGSKRAFGWLEQRTNAGRKGGLRKREPEPKRPLTTAKRPLDSAKALTLTLTPSQENTGYVVSLPRLAALWNQHCGSFPKVRGCSSQRKKFSELRWKENPEESYWIEVINRMKKSEFCSGKGKTGWTANFDFFIRPETHHKVLEGAYDDSRGAAERLSPLAMQIAEESK